MEFSATLEEDKLMSHLESKSEYLLTKQQGKGLELLWGFEPKLNSNSV